MTKAPDTPETIRLAALSGRRPVPVRLTPDAQALDAIADRLGLIGLKKLRFEGELVPEGREDWRLAATLGATVVQPCVVTLAPVTTRLEAEVVRVYRARFVHQTPPPGEAEEIEMPEDETEEPLPEQLNLAAVMEEALALALPLYPRAEGADLGEAVYGPPGAEPLRDADLKPFAGLAELKKKLEE